MEKLNLNNERIEITVLRNFIFNEAFTRKALTFCKVDYFTNRNERLLFREIDIFVNKYKNIPTKEALVIELGQRKDINEDEFKSKLEETMEQMSGLFEKSEAEKSEDEKDFAKDSFPNL